MSSYCPATKLLATSSNASTTATIDGLSSSLIMTVLPRRLLKTISSVEIGVLSQAVKLTRIGSLDSPIQPLLCSLFSRLGSLSVMVVRFEASLSRLSSIHCLSVATNVILGHRYVGLGSEWNFAR